MRIMSAQVFADGQGRGGSFAGGADQLLGAASAHISGGEDALCTGLEIDSRHDKALLIKLDNIFKGLAIGREANEKEDAGHMQFAGLAALAVFEYHGIQVILLAFELNDFCVET